MRFNFSSHATMATGLTLNEVKRRLGFTAYILRNNDRIALIALIARASGGQRCKAASDMDWLGFLFAAKDSI